MRNPIKILAGLVVAAALCGTAQAQISYTTSPTVNAWLGTPIYVSLANASLGGVSVQGDPAITGTYGVLAETFTPSSSFTLGSFDLIDTVGTAGTFVVGLFDLGVAGTVSVSSSAATYTPGANLFSVTSVTLTTSGEVQGIFTLPAADEVTLQAGEEYALEIWTPSALGLNAFVWYRSGTADPGGQMFSDANSANARATLFANGQAGGAPRTGSLALYTPVPEPASMVLLGLGALVGTFVIRRRK